MEQKYITMDRVFDNQLCAFAPLKAQSLPGGAYFEYKAMDTGVKVLENGDVYFGYYAPEAQNVAVHFGPMNPIVLEKGEDGIWKGILPFNKEFVGAKTFSFRVDGAEVVSHFCPTYFIGNSLMNYVEIPDPNADFLTMRDVPHGSIVTEFYWSSVLEEWERLLVYLPPMYHEGGEYPVLYLQHGYSENETSWIYNAKINFILDNLIADGKAEPFIVVMAHGMFHGKYNVFADFQAPFEKSLIECVIPFIESKYRVIKDKWHRGIAGFSMGSMQASLIGLHNMDKFAYIGLLSGFMRRVGGAEKDKDKSLEVNEHLLNMFDRENFEKEIKLFFRGIGSNDGTKMAFDIDDELLEEHGMTDCPNLVRFVAQGYPHDWSTMRILFHEFAQKVFK